MFRILTIAVVFHWSVIFSMIAFMCVLAGSGGAGQALTLIGLGAPLGSSAILSPSVPMAAVAATLFALCAVLFWWAFLTVVLNGEKARAPGDIVSLAFAASVVTLSTVFLYGATQGLTGLFPTIAVHVAALLVSYLAINAERLVPTRSGQANDGNELWGVRHRVNEASRVATLVRFSAKPSVLTGEGR